MYMAYLIFNAFAVELYIQCLQRRDSLCRGS